MVSLPPASGRLVLEQLFPVALARVQLAPDPLDTARQLQSITQLRGTAQGNPDPGCAWTGDLNGIWQLHLQDPFQSLIAEIASHAWRYLEQLGFARPRVALHIQRCWPVVSEAGQVIGRHHHPNAHLSAVYYLNGDGSGRSGCLRLFPPARPNELVPGLALGHAGPIETTSFLNAPWVDVAPQAGLLLLFPASLDHGVLENEEDDDLRFSLSIDFVLTAPLCPSGATPPEYLAPHPSQWQQLQGVEAVGEDESP